MKKVEDLSSREDVDVDDLLKIQDHANRAVDLWNGLDQWMKKGGALPEDWAGDRGTP